MYSLIRKATAVIALLALHAPFAWGADIRAALIVEDLRCRGNAATSCEFILGHVYLGHGERLDERELRNAQLRLAALRLFDSVDIFLERGSERGKAIVVIDVREADPLAAEWLLAASYRLGSFVGIAAGRVAHQNLFGAGKLADLTVLRVQPLNEPSEDAYAAALRYADRICSARGGISES